MELSDLRYFLNAATAGSFVEGAALSHISAPAMSKAIKRLEGSLGVRLFERTTRRVHLTEAGERVRARAVRLLHDARAVREELEGMRGEVGGVLRVGANEVFSIELLPDALCELVAAHPAVEPHTFEMIPELQARYLAEGLLDVGLTIGAQPSREIAVEVVGRSPGRLVCGRTHPLYAAGRVSVAELRRYPSVVPRFFGKAHLPSLDQFPEPDPPRRVGATIELLQMGVRLAIGGAYLGYFPQVSVQAALDDGRLRALQVEGLAPAPAFELQALLRRDLEPRRAALALLEAVRRRVARTTEE